MVLEIKLNSAGKLKEVATNNSIPEFEAKVVINYKYDYTIKYIFENNICQAPRKFSTRKRCDRIVKILPFLITDKQSMQSYMQLWSGCITCLAKASTEFVPYIHCYSTAWGLIFQSMLNAFKLCGISPWCKLNLSEM